MIDGNRNIENITPHKIAVIAFIREFGLLKQEAKEIVMFQCTMAPKYRKDFCMLALKLIQCPDMEFKELETLITNGKYNLLSVHLQKFCSRFQTIYSNGVGALIDCITTTVDKLMIEPNETSSCMITRNSVLGFYLRRILLNLEKLSFPQVAVVYRSFCVYYQKGRPGLMIRSLSKERLNAVEPGTSPASPVPQDESKQDISMKINVMERDIFEECQWSRKQAELFTAQQANLIQLNEAQAMPPKQLQKVISQINKDVPNYADAHFLSFLNCMRVREFSGAQDALYSCFDRAVCAGPSPATAAAAAAAAATSNEERNKSFRYAALNKAAMHALLGHNAAAVESLSEALRLAQEAGDVECANMVTAWMALCGSRGQRGALLPRVTHAPTSPSTALASLLLARHTALNATPPSHVLSLIVRTEAINYLHSLTELTLASLANTAALWALYGNTEMAAVTFQLLLNMNTKCGGSVGVIGVGGAGSGAEGGARWAVTEAGACGAAGVAAVAGARGDPAAAPASLHSHARHRHTATVHHRHRALTHLYAGKWQEAEDSIQYLSSIDRWESQLLKGEMYFLKGEPSNAVEALSDILDNCTTDEDSTHFVVHRLKAMMLMSQVQSSYSGSEATCCASVLTLNEAVAVARKYHLLYLSASAEMHIAHAQLHMGSASNALAIVRRALPVVMAHGGCYDMARGMLLYSKCRVATAPSGEMREHVLLSCCDALDAVRKNFSKVDACFRLKETLYLQAQLYNEVGNLAARNQCAWLFRQLDTQNPTEPTSMLLTSY